MLKIGKLQFNKKALLNLAACFFMIGLPIGFLVAYVQDTGSAPNPVFLIFGLMGYNFGVYSFFLKRVKKEVKTSL